MFGLNGFRRDGKLLFTLSKTLGAGGGRAGPGPGWAGLGWAGQGRAGQGRNCRTKIGKAGQGRALPEQGYGTAYWQ